MSETLSAILIALAVGTLYLGLSRNISMKRWLLPVTTAGFAALLARYLAIASGGSPTDYAIGIPLGMSVGLVLYHLFDYCRRCGAMRLLRLPLREPAAVSGHKECPGCARPRR